MNTNEIKKALYREKPVAKLQLIRKGIAHYMAETSIGTVQFDVVVAEMGDAGLYLEMPNCQLLARYITTESATA